MPHIFMERWIEDCTPNQADKLEHFLEVVENSSEDFFI
jgi:hypothetical protein